MKLRQGIKRTLTTLSKLHSLIKLYFRFNPDKVNVLCFCIQLPSLMPLSPYDLIVILQGQHDRARRAL